MTNKTLNKNSKLFIIFDRPNGHWDIADSEQTNFEDLLKFFPEKKDEIKKFIKEQKNEFKNSNFDKYCDFVISKLKDDSELLELSSIIFESKTYWHSDFNAHINCKTFSCEKDAENEYELRNSDK